MDANGEWGRLHNQKLHRFYHSLKISSGIKSRKLRWACHVARMEDGRSALKTLTVEPTGKILLGKPSCRWEDNIRMNLKEIGINSRNWVNSAQDRDYLRALVNAALNRRVP